MSDDFLDKKLERKMNARHGGPWWYVEGSAPDKHGRMKPFLIGPYVEYEKARAIAESKKFASHEIFSSQYSDLSRVSQIRKAARLQGNASIQDVFERLRHKGVANEETI